MNGQSTAVLILTLSTIFLTIMSESSFAATNEYAIAPTPPVAANDAASLGKTIVARLVKTDSQESSDLGFLSPEEATEANMTVGTGMAIMSLNLDKVKAGDAPVQITDALRPTDEFLYPVLVQGKVRSAITVRKIGTAGDWRPVAYGARGALLAAEQLKLLESAFIVRFYARNLWFLAVKKGGELAFYRLKPNPMSSDGIGAPENSKTVFAELLEEAKRVQHEEPGTRLHR